MFSLPDLPYGFGELAPVISETTLRTHHGKHHARYVQVVNSLLADAEHRPASLEAVVADAQSSGKQTLFNNAAQAWNHGFLWVSMTPGRSEASAALQAAIAASFRDMAGLREAFVADGAAHFGSGWVWLLAKGDVLFLRSTHDAGTPLTAPDVTPLLVCDVWEHAYYLDHKNDRAAFLSGWWDRLIDWDFASRQFAVANGDGIGWRYPAPGGAHE